MFKIVTPEELKKWILKDEVLLIDVRELAENQAQCIKNACLIPVAEIAIQKLPKTDRKMVLYCKAGKRSQIACEKLLQDNADLELYMLEGGIDAWAALGLPTQQSSLS